MITVTFFGLIYNILLDIPYTFYVETCLAQEKNPRHVTPLNMIAMRGSGLIFSASSVVIDALMVRFIKKTILPTAANQLQIMDLQDGQLNTITGQGRSEGRTSHVLFGHTKKIFLVHKLQSNLCTTTTLGTLYL